MIERTAYELLAYIGADEFPINPFEVEYFFTDVVHILAYTELQVRIGIADPLDFDKRSRRMMFNEKARNDRIEGETRKDRSETGYLIVYDDRVVNKKRVRWTIVHELGHIFLGHFIEFEIVSIERGGTAVVSKFALTDK